MNTYQTNMHLKYWLTNSVNVCWLKFDNTTTLHHRRCSSSLYRFFRANAQKSDRQKISIAWVVADLWRETGQPRTPLSPARPQSTIQLHYLWVLFSLQPLVLVATPLRLSMYVLLKILLQLFRGDVTMHAWFNRERTAMFHHCNNILWRKPQVGKCPLHHFLSD